MKLSNTLHSTSMAARLLVAGLVLLLAACGATSDGSVLDRGDTEGAYLSLDISASEITPGGSVTLTWASREASACMASGDWSGNKGISGREVITGITGDSRFIISCNSPEGLISDYAEVRVVEQPVAPSLEFTSSGTELMQGESVTLAWSAVNADRCTASGDWSGDKGISGSQTINDLQQDSLYILECTGSGRSVRQTVTVNVQLPDPVAPTLSFNASQTSIPWNGSVTLSWSSTDTDSCVASGDWSGPRSATGSETLNNLTADAHYVLDCSGPGGSVSHQLDVTVAAQQNNGTARLSWTPPTENTDNTPLDDLSGYKIYYGTASGNYSTTVDVSDAGITEYLIENLSSGTWYFVVTAYNSLGIESAPSEEVSKTIN